MNLAILAILKRFWPVLAGAVLLFAVVHSIHRYGDGREADGRSAVQAKWDAANKVAEAKAAQVDQERKLKDAQDDARNQEIAREHEQELAAIATDRDRLARLLHNAAAPASGGSGAAQIADQPTATETGKAPSVGSSDGPTELERAIADTVEEARANASQLNALIGEALPQM